MTPLVRTAAALTEPFGFGAKVVSSVPSALSRARLLYGTPPMLLNDPPTIVWSGTLGQQRVHRPVGVGRELRVDRAVRIQLDEVFFLQSADMGEGRRRRISRRRFRPRVKVPPRKIEPSLRIAIALTPELSPGSKVESNVPSELTRAMKSRVVVM